MEATTLINKILSAKSHRQVFTSDYKKEYRQISLLIHPDKCSLPKAQDAFDKLTEFKKNIEDGITFSDGICNITVKGKEIIFEGDSDLLKTSLKNYKILKAIADKQKSTFARYMPIKGEIMDGKLYFTTEEEAISVSNLTLEEEHVRWVLSRLLSYVAWLEKEEYVHTGINPESFCIAKNHGIYIISFYHLTKASSKLNTISAKYLTWYNPSIFKDKIAIPSIDLTMVKKSAIYLLGDRTGVGTPLKRKPIHEKLVEYLLKFETSSKDSFFEYRGLVKNVFGSKFHELEL